MPKSEASFLVITVYLLLSVCPDMISKACFFLAWTLLNCDLTHKTLEVRWSPMRSRRLSSDLFQHTVHNFSFSPFFIYTFLSLHFSFSPFIHSLLFFPLFLFLILWSLSCLLLFSFLISFPLIFSFYAFSHNICSLFFSTPFHSSLCFFFLLPPLFTFFLFYSTLL